MPKFRLPKPISSATDEQFKEYLEQFDPAGDRRLLATEILRLRAMGRTHNIDPRLLQTDAVAAPRRLKANEADDALI